MSAKITELDSLTGAGLASADQFIIVDRSDHTMASSGTNKNMTAAEVAAGLATVGNLATDAEVSAAVAAHVSAGDPHTQYAQESALATIATSGSASNLVAGTVPTARLGSGSATVASFLRGDQAWSTPPSLLDAGIGAAYPWKGAEAYGTEMWKVANFVNHGSGWNTSVLNPTLTSNGAGQTMKTSIFLGSPYNARFFRFSYNVTSIGDDGYINLNVSVTSDGVTVLPGTSKQRLSTYAGSHALGYFEFDFWPQNNGSTFFIFELELGNGTNTGTTTVSDCSLKAISHISPPMLYADGGGGTNPTVFTRHLDPVSGQFYASSTVFVSDNELDNALREIMGYTPNPWDNSGQYPDHTLTQSTVSQTVSVGTTQIGQGVGELARQLRANNNDQILWVWNGSAYELRGNTHGGETNSSPAVMEVDRGDGVWHTWSQTGLIMKPCRRFRMTWPTEMQLSTGSSPFATVSHVTTLFNDGVARTDRTTTFIEDVRMGDHIDWMSSHSITIPKLGRIGRGLQVLDEVDIHQKLAAPSSPSVSTSTSGGTLAAATYRYAVTSCSAMGESTPTALVTQVTTGSTSKNTVSWSAVSGATGYRVYGRTGTYPQQTLLATIAAGTTSWEDTGSAVPEPGRFAPDVNRARLDAGAECADDIASHDGANWVAWYDMALNMVFANLYDRDAVQARDEVASVATRLTHTAGIVKSYINVYFVGDGGADAGQNNEVKSQAITTGTEWTATHWNLVYCPADRNAWHTEAAIKSMDLTKLKEMYPAT